MSRGPRIFAVALRIDPDRTVTVGSFRDALAGVLDAHVEPARMAERPTVVALPEHTGLLAAFIGARGEAARERLRAGAPAVDALTALAMSYGDQLGHYAAAYPEVTSPGQLLHLALTDTLVRGLVEPCAALAAERGLWLTVGAALARWQRVEGPQAAALAPPDADSAHAYVACEETVRNRNLVFDPDGRLVAIHDKAYLVPIEADTAGGLGLQAADVADVTVADLPIGRLGSVISKDAWMPDVNERLDQLGAQLLIQPEAYDRWGMPDRQEGGTDLWPPDKLQRGGWWMVQQHRSLRVNATPMLTGNIGDLTFDGQPLVAVPAPAGADDLGLLGQDPDAGWAAVGPWDGVGEAPPALARANRRPELADHAARLLPGSGDRFEGAVAEGAAWADVDLPERPVARPGPLPPAPASTALPGPAGTQLVPHLAAAGGTAVLAAIVVDERARQRAVVHRGDGDRWDAGTLLAHPAELVGDQHDRQWRPRLAAHGDGVVLVFTAFPSGSWDVFATHATAARGWSSPVRVDDAHPTAGVLRERGHSSPVLASAGDTLVAVWSDLRWPWVLPQVRSSRSDDAGATWSPSRRVDGGALDGQPDPLAGRSPHETRGQAAPAAAVVAAGLLVAWQERSHAGGQAVWVRAPGSTPVRLSTPGSAAYRPALCCSGASCLLVWEEDAPAGGGGLVARWTRDSGRTWTPPFLVDPTRPAGVTQRHPTVVALPGEGFAVVFGDDRTGDERILAARLAVDATSTRVRPVSDTPPGAAARAPAAAVAGDRLVVAWQDTRGGEERIRSSSLPIGLLGPLPSGG